MSSDNAPDQPHAGGPPEIGQRETGQRETGPRQACPPEACPLEAGPRVQDSTPILPVRSLDETDVGWGERGDPDQDERFRRDRPPHWDAV